MKLFREVPIERSRFEDVFDRAPMDNMMEYLSARVIQFKGMVWEADQDTVGKAYVDIRTDSLHKGIDPLQTDRVCIHQ
jgi:hypothetical protein